MCEVVGDCFALLGPFMWPGMIILKYDGVYLLTF